MGWPFSFEHYVPEKQGLSRFAVDDDFEGLVGWGPSYPGSDFGKSCQSLLDGWPDGVEA